MSAVAMLEVVQVLNGLLSLGVNGLVAAKKVGVVLEQSIQSGEPISKDVWRMMMEDADVADARLAATIRRMGESQ